MNPQTNPFTALSLIAAPAVLTNSSSVLALGTSNRLARVVDRTRQLSSELEQETDPGSLLAQSACLELKVLQRRMLMLIRALRTLYGAIGGFAAAALISLAGAVFTPLAPALIARAIEVLALCIGTVAVGALVRGALLLMQETRLAVRTMEERARQAQLKFTNLGESAKV